MEDSLPGDVYADYCQWPYNPPAPTGGKLRQSSMLWASLEAAGAHPNLAAACRQLRRVVGSFRTVFGVKLQDGRLSFEFYFYDYARVQRALSIPRVLAALRPYVSCSLQPAEDLPYFMFSLDLDHAIVTGGAVLDEIDIYIGNPGSTVSSGICYAQRASGIELKNLYFFFDAQAERGHVVDKVLSSAHIDASFDPGGILWPELVDCGVIVVANKRRHDGIYFSRIRAEQLAVFFEKAGWPRGLVELYRLHQDRFRHLLFDVGLDYSVENGRAVFLKSAFYGLL